jgi:hypothetical protein
MDGLGRTSGIIMLTTRLQAQQLEIGRLTEENISLKKQMETHVGPPPTDLIPDMDRG